MSLRKAAFLDRDGVINVDRGYVWLWDDFEFLPGVVEAMRALEAAGYALIVITNQSGIARGYYSEASFLALTDRIERELAAHGVHLSGTYYCPPLPAASMEPHAIKCDCRKPMPGMIQQAAREIGIDLSQSIIVGDKESDVAAGVAAGIPSRYLVCPEKSELPEAATDACLSLSDCVAKLGVTTVGD